MTPASPHHIYFLFSSLFFIIYHLQSTVPQALCRFFPSSFLVVFLSFHFLFCPHLNTPALSHTPTVFSLFCFLLSSMLKLLLACSGVSYSTHSRDSCLNWRMEAGKCAAGLSHCLVPPLLLAGAWHPSFSIKVALGSHSSHDCAVPFCLCPASRGMQMISSRKRQLRPWEDKTLTRLLI